MATATTATATAAGEQLSRPAISSYGRRLEILCDERGQLTVTACRAAKSIASAAVADCHTASSPSE
jgi:hypothetical protein